MDLSRFARLRFAHLPTPLEPMVELGAVLGGPELWVKRDDCTGLATGGNKARKLEFLMAAALEADADTVITHGAVQSNHVRQTAAIATRLGLHCEVLLEDRVPGSGDEYRRSGNVLLTRLLGAKAREYAAGAEMDAAMAALAEELRAAGRTPYVIPGGGSNALGAMGYAACAQEIVEQLGPRSVGDTCILCASGSGGTHAGLLAGLASLNCPMPVVGISVHAGRQSQEAKVHALAKSTAELIGSERDVQRADVVCHDEYVGEGYGIPVAGTLEAVQMAARSEGLLLDPVYTGKAMAGLIDLVRKGLLCEMRRIVFLHTGGSAALFAYRGLIEEFMASHSMSPA